MASFLDNLFTQPGTASKIATDDPNAPIQIAPHSPAAGEVLTAIDGTHAEWAPPTGGGGGDGVDEVARDAAAAAQASADAAQADADTAQGSATVAQASADAAQAAAGAAQSTANAANASITAHAGSGGAAHALASESAAGFFSPEEKAQLAALVASGGGGGGGGAAGDAGNMYWAKPAIPDAFDDEFESGSPDLAARGWLAVSTAGTPMTRAGEVLPWGDASAIPSNQYRSTLTASGMLIQCSAQMNVLKPVSGSFQLRCYAHPASFPSGGTNYVGPAIASNTLLTPASTKYAYILHYGSNEEAARHDSGHVVLQNRPLSTAGEPGSLNQLLDWNDTSKQLRWLSTRPWGWTNFYGSYTWGGFSATHAGLTIHTQQSTPHTFAVVRFVRRAPQDSYPTAVGGGSAIAAVGGDSSWLAPPAAPNAWDDEFQDGSADLAARGWTVCNSSGAIMTRVGPIDPWTPPTLTPTEYLSSLTPSGLIIQARTECYILKALPAAACTVMAVMSLGAFSSNTFYNGAVFTSGIPFNNNSSARRFYTTTDGGVTRVVRMETGNAYTVVDGPSYPASGLANARHGMLVTHNNAGTFMGLVKDATSDLMVVSALQTMPGLTPAAGGVLLAVMTTGSESLRWVTIRNIRLTPVFAAHPGFY